MEDWEEKHVLENLFRLMHLTNCNVELLACLNQLFSQQDIEIVLSKRTSVEKADALYRTAIQKNNGYDKLALALQSCKQSGALKIIVEGYIINNKLTPPGLNREDLDIDDNFTLQWQGKILTLEELLGKDTCTETTEKLYNTLKRRFNPKPIPLLKAQLLPQHPKNYVQRILSYIPSTQLNESIFTSTSTKDHVFLFKETDRTEIARLTRVREPIDESWNQLRKLTIRFICLQSADHFDRICKLTLKPVHLIQREYNAYNWVKSSGGLDVVQRFFINERTTIGESEMVAKITSGSCSISISDTPGMGKTVLLRKLARLLTDSDDQYNAVFFIVLHELVSEILLEESISTRSPMDAILGYVSTDQTAKMVLTEMLKTKTWKVYLFLDGYDEVSPEKLEVVDKFLKLLVGQENVRIIATTQPHLRTRLENIFSQISYEILPFSEFNQTHFLTDYWSNHAEFPAYETDMLIEFAQRVLKAVQQKMTDVEKKITGVPLQCMMLGEVYAEDARSASNSKTLSSNAVTSISFFDVYKKLVTLKFNRIADLRCKQQCFKKLIQYALALQFPEWSSVFKSILDRSGKVDESTLYSIGLVEQSTGNTPRFVHRTFAEYLLAEFIVRNLHRYRECLDLLFTQILGRTGVKFEFGTTWKGDLLKLYDLKHPVIGYFIEIHMEEYAAHKSFKSSIPSIFSNIFLKTKFNDEDVCVAACASASQDLEHTFDFTRNVLRKLKLGRELWHNYLIYVPYLLVQHSNNFMLLEKALEFTESKFKDDYIPNTTALHAAAALGKFNMVTRLLDWYNKLGSQFPWQRFQNVLHACVHESATNSDFVIEDKLLIVDSFLGINPGWIDERDEDDLTPLLQSNPHLNLLKRLVLRGADINAYSIYSGTFLHRYFDKSSYTELVRWAFSCGFERANQTNKLNENPLMYAIWKFGTVDDTVIELFRNAGVNWNAQNIFRDSVLLYALNHSDNVELITKLVEHGANVTHKNWEKQDAAHKVMLNQKLNSSETVEVLKFLESKGFNRFNEKDSNDRTPQEIGRMIGKLDSELVTFFNERDEAH